MSGQRPRRRLAGVWLFTVALALGAHAAEPAQWVVLDPDLQREGDRTSREREGPWVQFTQRWGHPANASPKAPVTVERMAVNCLTGAYGQTRYPATDPRTGRQIIETLTLDEIEHAQAFDGRLLLDDNATALGRALIDFACTCPSHPADHAPSPAELQAAYTHYVAAPLSKEEYHLKYLRVSSERKARAAIAEIVAGKPFEAVFDQYATPADALSFPHGDLGTHLETEWPIADVRRFRRLRVGDISRVPHEGLYGWEVVQLASKRTIAAPSLTEMLPRLQQYLARAQACGWGP